LQTGEVDQIRHGVPINDRQQHVRFRDVTGYQLDLTGLALVHDLPQALWVGAAVKDHYARLRFQQAFDDPGADATMRSGKQECGVCEIRHQSTLTISLICPVI
jgi:hypothetical protein